MKGGEGECSEARRRISNFPLRNFIIYMGEGRREGRNTSELRKRDQYILLSRGLCGYKLLRRCQSVIDQKGVPVLKRGKR